MTGKQKQAIVEIPITNLGKALPLFTTPCFSCPTGAHMIWQHSAYRFVIPDRLDENDEQTFKEIYIDVADSAPSFPEIKDTMKAVIDQILEMLPKNSIPFILDFGAGKLRNTVYLLEKGCNVAAVEFESMQTKDKWKPSFEKALSFDNRFIQLVFPHKFFSLTLKFNLVLLVNVCNVMPVPSERSLVLQYCRQKMDEDALILWYTQHRDGDVLAKCVPEVKIGDGYYMNKAKCYQTFYRDFENEEIDSMFLANGFRLEKSFSAGKNQARLYRKVGKLNPMERILTASKIRQHVLADIKLEEKKIVGTRILGQADSPSLNIPNPEELRDENLLIEALQKLPKGNNPHATEYHNLMAAILYRLLIPPLSNPRLEFDLDDGLKRADIVMNNSSESGFFGKLFEKFDFRAPYVFIECKNYEKEIGNVETDQMNGRMTKNKGRLGILTYREVKKPDKLLRLCKTYAADNRYILTLSDAEIIELLKLRMSDESIDGFLFNKMRELILT